MAKKTKTLDEPLKACLLEAAEVWEDKDFLRFIERYQPELYEAFLDFMVDTDYETLGLFNQAIFWGLPWRDGRVVPEKMNSLAMKIEGTQQGRNAWLA